MNICIIGILLVLKKMGNVMGSGNNKTLLMAGYMSLLLIAKHLMLFVISSIYRKMRTYLCMKSVIAAYFSVGYVSMLSDRVAPLNFLCKAQGVI